MIRNQWYVVLESNEVENHPIGITRLGEKMVFWRDQAGKVCAAYLRDYLDRLVKRVWEEKKEEVEKRMAAEG